MERYRVNYTLLIGLLVGLIVAAGAIFGIWTWQMSRNADTLLARASEAEEEGDIVESVLLLENYLGFRPDDQQTRLRQAHLYVDVAKQAIEEGDPRMFWPAKNNVSDALFDYPQEDELRKDLVDLLTGPQLHRQFAKDVHGHLTYLLEKKPDDSEMLTKQALSLNYMGEASDAAGVLYKLVGYDRETDDFDASKAVAPNDIEAYRVLTTLLIGRLERRELAARLQDYMLEQNPDSADAHLLNASYLATMDQGEGSPQDFSAASEAALQKAYELDPKKPEILLELSRQARVKKDFELAEEYLQKGLDEGADNWRFYSGLAMLERVKGDYQSGIAKVEEGLDKVDEKFHPFLLLNKADMLIGAGDLDGAKKTIRRIDSLIDIKLPQVKLYEARLMAAENQWYEASRALEDVRPELAGDSGLLNETDLLLGMAYKQIGANEKALKIYEGLQRRLPTANPQVDLAVADLQRRVRPNLSEEDEELSEWDFDGRLAKELEKPEEEQDWDAFNDYLLEFAEAQNREPVKTKLLQTQVLVRRKKYDEAEKLLSEAYSMAQDDMTVHRLAAKLVAVNPDGGVERAMKMLDRTFKEFGDQPMLRLDRADFHLTMNKETLVEDLMSLTKGMDDWENSQKVQVWEGVATRLTRAGRKEEAELAWQKVAELNPNDLPTAMQVFDLALARNDDEAMAEAQQKILDLVGSKDDPNWAITEAARKFTEYRRDTSKQELASEIRSLINTAINGTNRREGRKDWSTPYILRARLAATDRDYLQAMKDFETGLNLGRGDPAAISQYVQLLVKQGSYTKALKLLDRYDPTANILMVGRLYPQILFRAGRIADAAEAAEKIAASGENNAAQQLWYGQFTQGLGVLSTVPEEQRKEYLEKGGEALKRAVELAPTDPSAWLAWITHLIGRGDTSAAELALREAQLTIDEDRQTGLLARCYEMLGRWFDAENIYQLAYEQQPESDAIAKQLATFYMGQRYPLPDGRAKAMALINDILRRQAETDKQAAQQNEEAVIAEEAKWARRVAASMLAQTNDYQNALKAEKLLASNSIEGTLAADDKLQMASILAQRPEPISRNKAIKLLEEVSAQQQLNPQLELVLAKLYFTSGNWPKCRDKITSFITRYPNSFPAREAYIRMLLQRGGDSDLRLAAAQVRELIRIAPQVPMTSELASLVYSAQGDKTKARQALRQMLPSAEEMKSLDKNEVALVGRAAQLLTVQEDIETAGQLYTILAQREGATATDVMRLAKFIGVHRDGDKAFEMLEKLSADVPLAPIMEVGAAIARANRDEEGDKYDEQLEEWLSRSKREDPDAQGPLLMEAEIRDQQGKYEQSAAIYRKLLDRDELHGRARAVVLNNLAYLLALGAAEETQPDEAVRLVREAVDILGPISDVLDTRAVIWLGRKEYQAAIDDLELAVTDTPTASKYYHKAVAHLGMPKQKSEALAAWNKAIDLGLTRDSINLLERDQFDQVESQMQQLQQRTGSL